ncbi:MAG TPA: hypothetical protein VGL38_04390 [bacterium]
MKIRHHHGRRLLLAAAVLFLLATAVQAHQLVLSTGYANSSAPKTGGDIDKVNPPFTGGGGFAVGVRADLDTPNKRMWISPAFLFWNNLTGAPDLNSRVNYFQMEIGGRVSVHTRTDPTFYGGAGVGYTLSHGVKRPRYAGDAQTFDGDFPSASIHGGVKLPNPSSGVTVLAEASYHFGLEQPTGHLAIGPARAALIQIGVAFDLVSGAQP